MTGYMREIACHLQPAALMTASSTFGVYARYRTAPAAVELYYVDSEMYRYNRTATAATVTAPFYGAALSVITYFLSKDKLVTPPSVNRQVIVRILPPFPTFTECKAHALNLLASSLSLLLLYLICPSRKSATGDRPRRWRSLLYNQQNMCYRIVESCLDLVTVIFVALPPRQTLLVSRGNTHTAEYPVMYICEG